MTQSKITISGKCETDDIASCVFRIRKVGATIRAQGQKELAEAIERAADRVSKARVKEEAGMEAPKRQFAPGYLPKQIIIYHDTNTIEKHYIDAGECQAKTFRILKPEPHILVSMCCAKGDKMKGKRCHPNPTIHKTIVPYSGKYITELEHLRAIHPEIPVSTRNSGGTKARVRESLTVTEPVEGDEHSVNIPLTCPGTQPVPRELTRALAESEVL